MLFVTHLFCLLLLFSSATTTNAADTTIQPNSPKCPTAGPARVSCGVNVSDEAACRAQNCSCWKEDSPWPSCFLTYDQIPLTTSATEITAEAETTTAEVATTTAEVATTTAEAATTTAEAATTTAEAATTTAEVDTTTAEVETTTAEAATTTAEAATTTAEAETTTAEVATTTAEAETTTAEAATTTADTTVVCPEGWIDASEFELGCLYFADSGLSWFDTQALCEGVQGFNAEALTLEQAKDLSVLAGLTSTITGKERWWLGLSDFTREGVWHWSFSYDTPVEVDDFASIWEPNMEEGNLDDCVVMALDGGSLSWVDIPCLETSHDGLDIQAMCQCKGSNCDSPTTVTIPDTTMEATTVETCGEGWSATETLGCLLPLPDPVASLQDARDACSSVNGYLVEAQDSSKEIELEAVAEVLHSLMAPWSWWLGLFWDGSAWAWFDPLEGLQGDGRWGVGQGSDGDNGEKCALITKVGVAWEWHDVACNSSEYLGNSIGVICQECTEGHCAEAPPTTTSGPTEGGDTTTPDIVPTTTAAPPDDCKYNSNDENSPCYLLNRESLSFEGAEAFCASYGGHLASSLSEDENTFIGGLLLSGGTSLPMWWIGARCGASQLCEETASWSWTDGSGWSYENWKAGDGTPGTSFGCAFFDSSFFTWKTYNCGSHFASVCKI